MWCAVYDTKALNVLSITIFSKYTIDIHTSIGMTVNKMILELAEYEVMFF